MIVAGSATKNESRRPNERGHPGLFHAATKLSNVKWEGDGFHHPRAVSDIGRTDTTATPMMGSNQASPRVQATTWIKMVRGRKGSFDGRRLGSRSTGLVMARHPAASCWPWTDRF